MKRFDGWEPATETTYHYDDTGRLAHATTIRESEWDDPQRDLMLALALYEAQVHEPCGGYLPDTTAADADDRYAAAPPVRCHLCTARMQAHHAHVTSPHAPHPEALLWPIRRRG